MSTHAAPDPDALLADRLRAPATLELPEPVELEDTVLTWRPLERGDESAVVDVVRAAEAVDAPSMSVSPAAVAERFAESSDSFGDRTIAAVDPAGRVRAYGYLEMPTGDTTVQRVFVHGKVHPDVRGHGVGTAALAWKVERAKQLLVASGRELPARIAAYAEEGAQSELALLEDFGFRPVRFYTYLRRDLSAPIPEEPLAPGLRLAAWSPEIDDAIRIAHNDAFRDHWGSEPVSAEDWKAHRVEFAPRWTFAVIDDEAPEDARPRVAGYLVSSRYAANWSRAGYTSGYTELLGVRRAYRGKRIANALLTAAMTAYAADGMQYAELDVDSANPSGAHEFYERLGYVRTGGNHLLSIEY